MKKILFFLLVITGCTSREVNVREEISLAGTWQFRIDSLDIGIDQQWPYLEFEETVDLPGSLAENGKGNEVTINTPWTGDIVDRSYFTESRYEKYRQPGNLKIPFWLKPVKYYSGAAWYRKDVEIPEGWSNKRIVLHMERCHWESTVYVNEKRAGSCNSLSTPHEYDLTSLLVPGRNRISVRIDNSVIIPIGVNSHSISDHTQSNWNGITGDIKLISTSGVYINDISIFPDRDKKVVEVVANIKNPKNIEFKGKLFLRAMTFNTPAEEQLHEINTNVITKEGEHQVRIKYKIHNQKLWSEFSPNMYRMTLDLTEKGNVIDSRSVDFGIRDFKTNGTRFEVNGQPVFLRGTTECCIFPLTGYPPSDQESWEKVLGTCREYGLNHVRFHSFCPPEAAFAAADKLGIYFHIECGSWANQGTTLGDGGPVDKFIYEEGDRIIREYGNHPSFCMLAYGNEPAGINQNKFLGDLINYWKAKDNRRVYTSAAGWPIIPENDYNLPSDPRIQHWGEGLKSIINSQPPQTRFDFSDFVSQYKVPTVGHEIGQWCVYPDFREMELYKGVLKPANFEIFRETLNEHMMGDQAESFLMASGKLQALCYKADIEAALRTPGYGGFQMLQLHDFPGQGTALVGILNPFFGSKGYITPEEFRMFCSAIVPLARMDKMIFKTDEEIKADIEIANFGKEALYGSGVLCRLINSEGETVFQKAFVKDTIGIGNCIPVGTFRFDPSGILKAQKMKLEVSVDDSGVKNSWDIWVYPQEEQPDPGRVLISDRLDSRCEEVLRKGGSVLLLNYGTVAKGKGAEVEIGLSSIFWNTAWTNNQAPHTLGILCNPDHPVFEQFPTEYHSNWQWWDPVSHSQAMIIDGFPPELKPLVQPIDTWFENRRLALVFEAMAGNGKVIVCSIDMKDLKEDRPASKQLLRSILAYMNSDSFNPATKVDLNMVRSLTGR